MALRELTVRVAGHLGDEPTTVVTLSFARERSGRWWWPIFLG